MSLDKIMSITGKPGLYKLKTQTRSGFVVESLTDNKTMAVGITHNVSILKDIAIYTYTEEVPLKQVFENIKQKEDGGKAISHKESKSKVMSYFEEVLPGFDEDRVYHSDVKKVLQWYNLLHDNGFTDYTDSDEEE